MRPELLRAKLAAKQHQRAGNIPQSVEYFSNKERGEVFMKFTHPTDHIMFTLDKAIHHGCSMIAASIVCGGKHDTKLVEQLVQQFKNAELAPAKGKA